MTNIITKGSLIQSIPPWSVIQNRWSSRCKYKYIYEWTMHEHTWWSTGQAILCSLNNRDKKSFLAQTQNMIFHENTSCLISSPNPKLIKTWTAGNKIAIGCIIFCFLNSYFIEILSVYISCIILRLIKCHFYIFGMYKNYILKDGSQTIRINMSEWASHRAVIFIACCWSVISCYVQYLASP